MKQLFTFVSLILLAGCSIPATSPDVQEKHYIFKDEIGGNSHEEVILGMTLLSSISYELYEYHEEMMIGKRTIEEPEKDKVYSYTSLGETTHVKCARIITATLNGSSSSTQEWFSTVYTLSPGKTVEIVYNDKTATQENEPTI